MPNRRDMGRGIPEDWNGRSDLVNGPNGWVTATPTQAPTRTPTNTNLEQMLYGRAADNIRGENGGTNWNEFLNLFLGGAEGWGGIHPEDMDGPSQMRTPTPEQQGPQQQHKGDMELIIKKKQYKPPKEEKMKPQDEGSMSIIRPKRVNPMGQ